MTTVHTRITICNRCQIEKLCFWLRRKIAEELFGNVWLCEPCSKTAYPRQEPTR